MTFARHAAAALFILCGGCAAGPSARAGAEAGIGAVADRFIRGVETFDADAVAATFADDAVAFMPSGPPQRFNGRAEIAAAFHALFDVGRAEGRTQAITPRRRNLQVFGDTAVLTFELGGEAPGPGRFGRRTAVLHRLPEGWRIVHLHASNVVVEPTP